MHKLRPPAGPFAEIVRCCSVKRGLRAYGGGILSSMNETIYSVSSDKPLRKSFDIIDILRTPYRIDIMQPIYFVIDHFDTLFHLTNIDLMKIISDVKKLKMHQPIYEV